MTVCSGSCECWLVGRIVEWNGDTGVFAYGAGRLEFSWRDCLRDGTSPGAIKVGDLATKQMHGRSVSSPNFGPDQQKPAGLR